MEEKIIITFDSGLDVDAETIQKYNLKRLPVTIKTGNEQTLDDGSVKPDDIVDYFKKTKDLVTTLPPTVQETFRFFTRYAHMGYTVIHFATSQKLSYAYDNAIAAAENFNKVHVIDSKAYTIGIMPLITKAAEMVQEGKSSDEIIKYCTAMTERIRMHVIIENLDFIHSGGRINVAQKLMLSVFGRIPTIAIEDGYFYTKKSYGGKLEKSAVKAVEDMLKVTKGIERKMAYLGHTGVNDTIIESCKKEMEQLGDFENIHIQRCGASTTTHYGDGGIVVCWVEKE